MATNEDHKDHEYYKNLLLQRMTPINVKDMPEVHELGKALHDLVKIKVYNHYADKAKKEHEERLREIIRQGEIVHALKLQQLKEEEKENDSDTFLGVLYTIGKVAAIAAVAYIAPTALAEAFPSLFTAGSVADVAATGVAVGTTDAAAQGVGVALGVQDHFSLQEVLESGVTGSVAAGAAGLGASARIAVGGAAAAATQEVEVAAGMRDHFDAKALGLQLAASIIATGIGKINPTLTEKLGDQGAKIASTIANNALNTVLHTAVNHGEVNIADVAATVVGDLAGQKLGETLTEKVTSKSQAPQTSTEPKVEESTKPNLDKMCLIDDKPVNDQYFEKLKVTPVQPSVDEFTQLVAQGKLKEAKQLVVEEAKTSSIKKLIDRASHGNPRLKKMLEEAEARLDKNKTSSTAKILMGLDRSVPRTKSAVEELVELATKGGIEHPYSVYNNASLLEKAVMWAMGIGIAVTVLPEWVLGALSAITTSFITGPITEAVLFDTFANPTFVQAAARLGILFGSAKGLSELPLLENTEAALQLPENAIFGALNASSSGVNKFNVNFFNVKSRFGNALYLSENQGKSLAELQVGTTQIIQYEFDRGLAKILDLTDPKIAETWSYKGEEVTDFTRSLAEKAKDAGYNVIRYSSGGKTSNLAVLDDFESLLKTKSVVPTPKPSVSGAVTQGGDAIPTARGLAEKVAQSTGREVQPTLGDGFKITIPLTNKRDLVIRVMEEGGNRESYYRVAIDGKQSFTKTGEVSANRAETHIDISSTSHEDIMKIIDKVINEYSPKNKL